MSLRKHRTEKQASLWIAHDDLARSPGHPFYEALNRVLAKHGFDNFAEERCEPYYREGGRPSITPGTYFRMLFVGYFEGIGSERGIEWRCADSLSLREFLRVPMGKRVPDHSSLSRIRQRLAVEVQLEIFQFVLKILAEEKLLSGKTLGVDATTLEANAAMRSIVRKDTGESYADFLTGLARESGIETPTRQELAKVDKQRKNKASNDDWRSPSDPESGITKMKDGSTHLAHKAEHAVDLETGAEVAVGVSPGHTGDPQSLTDTLSIADANLAAVHLEDVTVPEQVAEVVTDKGYHNNATLVELAEDGTRSYVSEPDRGRRSWQGRKDAQAATYANRSRIRGSRGKRLLKLRAERVERSFAHIYDTGGMRRCWLRGTVNILKRLLVHVAAFNLGLIMRKLVGRGTPRGLAELAKALFSHIFALINAHRVLLTQLRFSFQQKHGFSFHPKRLWFLPAVFIAA